MVIQPRTAANTRHCLPEAGCAYNRAHAGGRSTHGKSAHRSTHRSPRQPARDMSTPGGSAQGQPCAWISTSTRRRSCGHRGLTAEAKRLSNNEACSPCSHRHHAHPAMPLAPGELPPGAHRPARRRLSNPRRTTRSRAHAAVAGVPVAACTLQHALARGDRPTTDVARAFQRRDETQRVVV